MTTEIVAADSTLTPEQAELQARARAFVEERLGIADRGVGAMWRLIEETTAWALRRGLWRELRVDRIWEGTSEIQRLTVARALERRGVERVLH
jgi:alkylation response protein AidB-like acyl-CoA dehydrogenase